jgi:uncharacterized protein YprB with RNaseH-like and TPR domain
LITLDIETTGLYPTPTADDLAKGNTEDFIVAIGCIDNFGLTIFSVPYRDFQHSLEAAEQHILRQFSNFVSEFAKPDEIFVTYNGKSFDIPFITSKLLKHSPKFGDFASFSDELKSYRQADLMDFAKLVSGRRMSKDEACMKLGNIYVPRKTDGLWLARLYKNPALLTENDHLEMLQHNAIDIASTKRLYNSVSCFPDFQKWISGI